MSRLPISLANRNALVAPLVATAALLFVWGLRAWSDHPFSDLFWGHSGPSQPRPPYSEHHPFSPPGGGKAVPSLENGPPQPLPFDIADPEAPFVSWPLKRVCDDQTNYVEGLVFICDNNSGGPGNIRNYIQQCLRYALEAGATGLVVPRIRKRSDSDLANLFTDSRPFSYMFDLAHFKRAFATSCPQITLYDEVTDIPGAVDPSIVTPGGNVDVPEPNVELITPKDYINREQCDWKDQNRHTDQWGGKFRYWLLNETSGERGYPGEGKPRLIRFNWGVLWDWEVYRDGPEFYATFGSVLKFNDELISIGKRIVSGLREMEKKMPPGQEKGRDGFLGLHLRTESDSLGFWPHYDEQSKGYLDKAREKKYRLAYLATGNATEATRFGEQAEREVGLKVVTAKEVLGEESEEYKQLDALSWDQQAVVDFVVLVASDFFCGVMPSSFSVYVTIRRHLRLEGLYTRPYKTGTEGDGLSYVLGRYDQYWEQWLFMWDGMWP